MKKTIGYTEPADYFPKSLRKKHKIGEYAEKPEADKKKTVRKSAKKKTK